MGWTGSDGNFKTPLEFFRHHFRKDLEAGSILDYDIAGGDKEFRGETEAYMAYRGDDGKVIGVVCLMMVENSRYDPRQKAYLIKVIGEQEGPHADKCPQRILDLLDEPPNEWAFKWRRRCGDTREWPGFEEKERENPGMSM